MKQENDIPKVETVTAGENQSGQRIDNFLLGRLKGVPKSRIYRVIRKGEVRVNKKRVKPEYKLVPGDQVRIPPVRVAQRESLAPPSASLLQLLGDSILFEDGDLLVLNKPAGLPVHGGTGVRAGLIESLRCMYSGQDFLELVHRLDKGTSGCIMVAKNARTLKYLNNLLRRRKVDKIYHALVCGCWPAGVREVSAALFKNQASGGARLVEVDADGKSALTRFRILRLGSEFTLVEAAPVTGRTHQIRVHAQLAGHPIAGDDKYNEALSNQELKGKGVNRLCLHAASLSLEFPAGQRLHVQAPYDQRFSEALSSLLPAEGSRPWQAAYR